MLLNGEKKPFDLIFFQFKWSGSPPLSVMECSPGG